MAMRQPVYKFPAKKIVNVNFMLIS